MEIAVLEADKARRQLEGLTAILVDSVVDGALVGFVLPFNPEQARAYWEGVFKSMIAGERLFLGARVNGQIAGTVQLYLSPEPNAPHRAEIFKLLVHRDFQGQGIGTALMAAAEVEALRRHRSLLLLDTVLGGRAERLYRRLGWREIGTVPYHFLDPYGNPQSSVYFMKLLDGVSSEKVATNVYLNE